MTRINCVPPSELTVKHLVAEYREIGRVFALVRGAVSRGERPDDKRNPRAYTLGSGHVRFFYPRLGFIASRFHSLVDEMIRRGYNPQYTTHPDAFDIPDEWWGDWVPDDAAISANQIRISERLAGSATNSAAKEM